MSRDFRRRVDDANSEQSQIGLFLHRARGLSGRAGGGAQRRLGGFPLAAGGDAGLRRHLLRADHRGSGFEHHLPGARNPTQRTAQQLHQRRHARVEDPDRLDPPLPGDAADAAGGRGEAQRVLSGHARRLRPPAPHRRTGAAREPNRPPPPPHPQDRDRPRRIGAGVSGAGAHANKPGREGAEVRRITRQRRAPDDLRRRGRVARGHLELDRQRDQIFRRKGRRVGRGRDSGRQTGHGARDRPRRGRSPRRIEADIQTFLPRPPPGRDAGQRRGAGTLHRPLHRQQTRRQDFRRERGRGDGQRLHNRTAAHRKRRGESQGPDSHGKSALMSVVLIVEDEQHLAEGLKFNLEAEGYEVEMASDGETALELLTRSPGRYDAVALDVMLPGKDGFEVALELREAGQYVPILMLTARSRPEDVLRGFEAGADDYVSKPFELGILLARLRGLLRRREWLRLSQTAAQSADVEVFDFSDKTIDFSKLELRAGGRTVQLTLMEAELLRYFIKHEGQAVSRQKLLEDVWGLREDTDTRAIDNFIVRLRRYIEDDPSNPSHLLTVRGVGYRFVAEPGE